MANIEPRRQVKIHFGLAAIANLLNVPDDVSLVRLIPTSDPDGVSVVLASERFDEVPYGAQLPYSLGLRQTNIGVSDGKVSPDAPDGDYWRFEVDV